MLRTAFWITSLLLLPLGLLLYFLPSQLSEMLAVSPLWLARGSGALVCAWAVALLAAGGRADRTGIVALVTGNLLLTATLVPAALRLTDQPEAIRFALLALGAALGLLALLGLLAAPRYKEPHKEVSP